MKTKKVLVAFDPQKPEKRSKDFLAPVWQGNVLRLVDLRSVVIREFGLVVFVGRDVSASDLFAKLVESGWKIEDVERTVKTMEKYVKSLRRARIGDVLRVGCSDCGDLTLSDAGITARGETK